MKKLLKIVGIIIGVFLVIGLILLYGPWHGFRDFWITTAMTTKTHQYLATWLYSDETIKYVLDHNRVLEPDENIELDMIEINDNKSNNTLYKDEFDKEVLVHDEGDAYKYIKLDGYNFDGYLAVIYDPSKISVETSKDLFVDGEYLVDMSKRNDAIVAINGGGFIDKDGAGSGAYPTGIVIKNGKVIQGGYGGIIGFTNENKMYLGYTSSSDAINNGIRDAVEFGPFLIVNGKEANIIGNGGYGIQPRAAIGQRKDGIVLLLVIDGRRADSVGASIKDVKDILAKYGAYNAANLDGGNSAVLVIDHKIVNRPIDWFEQEQTRKIATGFIVKK